MTRRPHCVVVAGPNGAGKSTIAPSLVRDVHAIGRYVNADTIAVGLAGFLPGIADLRAGRIALQTMGAYIEDGLDFAFETTLAGRRWPRLLEALDRKGYVVHLHYLWLPTPELAIARVRYRVARGGHDIPDEDIRRRFVASLRNLRELWLPRVAAWQVFDASRFLDLSLIATGERGARVRVADRAAWKSVALGESPSAAGRSER